MMPLEELTDILVANNFGSNIQGVFRSHRVVVGKTSDGWLLYPVSEATGSALRKLFRDSVDVEIGPVTGPAIASPATCSLYRADL